MATYGVWKQICVTDYFVKQGQQQQQQQLAGTGPDLSVWLIRHATDSQVSSPHGHVAQNKPQLDTAATASQQQSKKKEKSKVNTDIAVRNRTYHTTTGNHMPYGYLLPGSGYFPAFTPAEAGTQFSDPGNIQGWVDLGGGYIRR